MMENLLIDFNTKGFPFISIIDGGFEACHNLVLRLGFELENHDVDFCSICTPEGDLSN